MLSHIENFHKLSELELVKEVNQQLDRAKEKIFEDGVEHGFKVCVARMLESGTEPEFVAKVANLNLDYVLGVIFEKEEKHK